MVSVATLRTFEIELSVSLTLWSSRVKPKVNVVLNLTIKQSTFAWRTITPGSTHPDKEVEHLPLIGNALC